MCVTEERLLTATEAAARAGVQPVTIKQARARGVLQAAQVGRKGNRPEYFYDRREIDRVWPREHEDSEDA